MRIAVLHPALDIPQGGEMQIAQLIRYLLDRGHEVTVFTFRYDPNAFQYDTMLDGAAVVERPVYLDKLPYLRFAELMSWHRSIARLINNGPHEVVDVQAHPAEWISHFVQVPTVWHCNDVPEALHRAKLLLPMHRLLTRRVARILTIHKSDKYWLANAGYRQRIDVVGSGAELLHTVNHVENDIIDVLHVGPLHEQRRLFDILEVVRKALKELNREFLLHVVGRGELEKPLRDRAASLGVPVRFYGLVSVADLYRLYDLADVALFLPEPMPWGIFPLEMILAGIPLIVTDCWGPLDMPEVEGLPSVPLGDTNRATELLVEIVNNQTEWHKKMMTIGSRLRPFVSWTAYGRRVERVLQDVV